MLWFSHPSIPSKEAHDGTCTRIRCSFATLRGDDDHAHLSQFRDGRRRLGAGEPPHGDADDPRGGRLGRQALLVLPSRV